MNFTDTGVITIASGTLEFDSATASFSGSVSGAGRLFFINGTQAVLNSGAILTVSTWATVATGTTVNENLTYAGVFSQGVGSTLTIAVSDTMSLTGAATFRGDMFGTSTVNGAGAVKLSSAAVGFFTVGGTATLNDVGTVDQTDPVTVGDASSNAATLSIGAGAAWRIDNDGGIARGSSAASIIRNSGLLIKSGGAGTSVIGVRISDSGTIEAASGTLDFTNTITGGGTMAVDSGATLQVDAFAAATLGMTFNGGNAILVLGNPASFKATIHAFAPTDTIDLLATTATAATLGAGDTLVIKNGATTVATLQLAGDYTAATFHVASDGGGGTNVTVTSGPVVGVPGVGSPLLPDKTAGSVAGHRFIAAMAGFGGDSHGPVSVFSEAHYTHPSMLSIPRMAMA